MKKLLIFYLLLSSCVSFAQNKTIDSLLTVLNTAKEDTVKVNVLNALSWQSYLIGNYDKEMSYAEEALKLSEKLSWKKGQAKALKYRGGAFYDKGNYADALKNYFASLKISEEIGDKKGIASTFGNIGLIYWNQENYAEALKNYFASLKIYVEIGDKYGMAACYNNIGIIYKEQGNYAEALKNYFASLKIYMEIGDKQGIADSYNNIGNIYYDHGNYEDALKNYFAGLKNFEESGNKDGITASYHNLGTIYLELGKPLLSKEYQQKANTVAKEIGSMEDMKSSYGGLSQADSALGNYKGAYENHKLYIQYRDSLINVENTKKTVQLQMQYDFDKKEAETKLLTDAELKKQKLVRNGFVGGFAVVLMFAGVFFRQRNKTKNEKKKSDALLLNILPTEVANELKTSGTSKAKAFTMVTVMFTDFKDFTTVSEKISAELLVDEIHHCFSAFDNILHKYKIEKIKTIGDAYLCASGLPVSSYTHAADMLHAAFEIRDFMLQRKKEKESIGEIPFELRIGIHTGPVVAGIVGVKKYAYDIWGDTVNIAARMEQNSEAGKVNISGATYELVKEKFNCEHRGKISAKNKGEIDMYFVETVS